MTSVGTSLPDDHDETKSIRPATLIQLHKLGFKLVPLSSNHVPVVEWTPIYEKLEYWPDEKLIAEYSKFKNVATAFGKSHVKALDGRNLFLKSIFCLISSLTCVLSLLVVCYLLYSCSRP
jgi:hypothetical protein